MATFRGLFSVILLTLCTFNNTFLNFLVHWYFGILQKCFKPEWKQSWGLYILWLINIFECLVIWWKLIVSILKGNQNGHSSLYVTNSFVYLSLTLHIISKVLIPILLVLLPLSLFPVQLPPGSSLLLLVIIGLCSGFDPVPGCLCEVSYALTFYIYPNYHTYSLLCFDFNL